MAIVKTLYYKLSSYVNKDEKTIAKFFNSIHENSNFKTGYLELTKLIQQHLAVINLWSEYRYKGYKYLNKQTRSELYNNLSLITQDFDKFISSNSIYNSLQVDIQTDQTKLELLRLITNYLSPKKGIYQYRESSSFGRLLRNPKTEQLIGDCNQIVTLYIHLYSQYFLVDELRLRVLPNHVALHFKGTDIEATNGTFLDYSLHKDAKLLPIQEIVSINLLDVTDSYIQTNKILPKDILQSARMAFLISSDKQLTARNLNVSYSILVKTLLEKQDYNQALTFAKQSDNEQLISITGHNGALYFIQKNRFSDARKFAKYSSKSSELITQSYNLEAEFLFKQKKYSSAIIIFKKANNYKAVKHCYEMLFMEEHQKLGSRNTKEQLKQKNQIIKKLALYAKKSENIKLMAIVKDLERFIS